MIHFVFTGIWVIYGVYMHEPIDIGTFWFLIQNRINDLMFYLLGVIRTGEINQVRGIFWYGFIITSYLDLWHIVLHSYEFDIAILDLPGAVPNIHDQEHDATDQ